MKQFQNKIRRLLIALVLVCGMILPLPVSAEETPVDMYRMYNPNSGEHFYTADENERNALVWAGWKYEGIGWVAPGSGDPVFRLYNPIAGDHHYTLSEAERDMLTRVGWKYEGVGWASDIAKRTPLHRLYNPNARTGTHHYTTNEGEAKSLAQIGWRREEIGWYGMEGGREDSTPIPDNPNPPAAPAQPDPAPSNPSNPSNPTNPGNPDTGSYLVNEKTKVFHRPTCASAKGHKGSHWRTVTGSADSLRAGGYKACRVCKP